MVGNQVLLEGLQDPLEALLGAAEGELSWEYLPEALKAAESFLGAPGRMWQTGSSAASRR